MPVSLATCSVLLSTAANSPSPVDATVQSVHYSAGLFVNASFDKASAENERNAMVLRLDDGTEVTCVQVAGLIARRILCYVKAGDRLARGQRYGFIRFGSRVDVFLPTASVVRAQVLAIGGGSVLFS